MSENEKKNNTSSKASHTLRSERKERWVDESGRLEEYFQVGRNLITTKKDYFVVLDKYAESGLATRTFCIKYGINNVTGFEKAVERRRSEDPAYDEKVSLELKKAEARAISAVVSVVTKTLKNRSALGVAIQCGELDGVNIDKFISICERFDKNGKKLSDTMLKLVAKYYFDRLNSYKANNTEGDIHNLLSNNEITFISPSGEEKIHEQKAFGVDTSPGEYFIRKANRLRKDDSNFYSQYVVGKQPSTIESGLKKYNYRFDMDEYLKTRNEYLIDGKTLVITPDDVYLAVAYAELANIYPGSGAIREIIRAVKMGKIKPTKALNAKVEEILAEKAKPKPDFESVDDYFNA